MPKVIRPVGVKSQIIIFLKHFLMLFCLQAFFFVNLKKKTREAVNPSWNFQRFIRTKKVFFYLSNAHEQNLYKLHIIK